MNQTRPLDTLSVALILATLSFGFIACGTSAPERQADEPPTTDQSTPTEVASLDEAASVLPNGAHPFENVVTAAQPTPDQIRRVDDTIHTVVNLRPHDESGARDESGEVRELGLEYVHLPIAGADDLDRERVEQFDRILRQKQGPFLVHCSSSNRVGALFALRAYWLADAGPEEALDIGRRAGLTRLQSAVRDKMTSHTPD